MKKQSKKLKLDIERIKVLDKPLTPEQLALIGGASTPGTRTPGCGSTSFSQYEC